MELGAEDPEGNPRSPLSTVLSHVWWWIHSEVSPHESYLGVIPSPWVSVGCVNCFSLMEQRTPTPRTGQRSRPWAAAEWGKLHLYLEPLPIARVTTWALPPVGSAAALDSHRSTTHFRCRQLQRWWGVQLGYFMKDSNAADQTGSLLALETFGGVRWEGLWASHGVRSWGPKAVLEAERSTQPAEDNGTCQRCKEEVLPRIAGAGREPITPERNAAWRPLACSHETPWWIQPSSS